MPLVYWTADLDTGFEDIDEQHKVLVERINLFADAFEAGNFIDTRNALENLIDYTVAHFSYEEEMLRQAEYHMLEPHKKVHENFVNKMVGMQTRFENGENAAGEELLNLLDGWLFRHIRLNDHGYVESVKKSGIR